MEYSDPIEAAKRKMIPNGQSYFPAANNPNFRLYDDRTSLLQDAENTFYGGGTAPPPSPTPTPAPQSYQQYPNKFKVPITNPVNYNRRSPTPANYAPGTGINQDQFEQMRQQYGWNT